MFPEKRHAGVLVVTSNDPSSATETLIPAPLEVIFTGAGPGDAPQGLIVTKRQITTDENHVLSIFAAPDDRTLGHPPSLHLPFRRNSRWSVRLAVCLFFFIFRSKQGPQINTFITSLAAHELLADLQSPAFRREPLSTSTRRWWPRSKRRLESIHDLCGQPPRTP